MEDLSAFGPRMKWLELPSNFQMAESNAAATEVRKRAKREWTADPELGHGMRALNGLVQPGVLAFILRNRLYQHLVSVPRPPPKLTTKVAVLGGAFSPITNTHMQLASEIIISGMVDQVRGGSELRVLRRSASGCGFPPLARHPAPHPCPPWPPSRAGLDLPVRPAARQALAQGARPTALHDVLPRRLHLPLARLPSLCERP